MPFATSAQAYKTDEQYSHYFQALEFRVLRGSAQHTKANQGYVCPSNPKYALKNFSPSGQPQSAVLEGASILAHLFYLFLVQSSSITR